MKRSPIKRKRVKRRNADPDYLAWIRSLCCWVCMRTVQPYPASPFIGYCSAQKLPTEAHHAGDHGFAQRAPDRTAIPLCEHHHRTGKESAHVLGKNFWAHHDLDRDAIIRELNARYEQER